MLVPAIRIVLTAGVSLLFASPATPQSTVGHLSHVNGSVTRLHRFGPTIAQVGVLLVAGDEVQVAVGRAEITLSNGSLVQLDEHTRVALHAADRIQLIDGRVFISSNGSAPLLAEAGGKRLHVAPGSAVEVTTTNSNDLLVRVVDGDARIESAWGSDAVAATQSAFVSGPTGRPFVSPWVASQTDAFHQWAGGRLVIVAPPAAFLPYAHPTYRQQEYQRIVRNQRIARRHSGASTPGDRHTDTAQRGDNQRGREQTRGADRRQRDRDDQVAQPKQRRPASMAPAVKRRGAAAGADAQ